MVRPKWVLFDVGVVLLDWPSSSQKAVQSLGVDYDRLMKKLASMSSAMNTGEIDPLVGWEAILKDMKVKESPQRIIDMWCATKYWNVNTLNVLKKVSETYRIGLFTNSWLQLRSRLESKTLPLTIDSVEALFDSSEIGFQKPSDEVFQFVEDNLSVDPGEIFLIDDDIRNIRAAQKRGWTAFLYHFSPDDGKSANEAILEILYK